MIKNTVDMMQLEQEIASVETNAVDEENHNAQVNYAHLDEELQNIIRQIPYPDTNPYDTGYDYEDCDRLKYEKSQNRKWWDLRDKLQLYCDDGSLYCGHIRFNGGKDYYVMDSFEFESRTIKSEDSVMLINSDDEKYAHIIRAWRYPDTDKELLLSRNLVLENRAVNNVDVVMDRDNAVFSDITDAYLRKALIRNKDKLGVQSIIQTIQKKQDAIRSLPVEESFIVQGCAGSGKTMVLLHRLRYLLFNGALHSDEYVFLVPSFKFKSFVKDISASFGISDKNILPYQSYYRILLGEGKRESNEDADELVFDNNYLSRVYSKTFLQECYQTLFRTLLMQSEDLITFCENQLSEIVEFETLVIDEEISSIKAEAISSARDLTVPIETYFSFAISDIKDIPSFINELSEIYEKARTEYEIMSNPDYQIVISPNDKRLVSNSELSLLREEVLSERKLVEKASIFTVRAHKNKLAKLEENYNKLYAAIEQEIIKEEKRIYAQRAMEKSYVFNGVTIESVKQILDRMSLIFESAETRLTEAEKKSANIQEYITEKYSQKILSLNNMIEISVEISEKENYFVSSLSPSAYFFKEVISVGKELLKNFQQNLFDLEKEVSEKEKIKKRVSLFAERTEQESQSDINRILFNICKKKLKEEFDVKICKLYKHYWYIKLYCQYLTRSRNYEKRRYIFIDEAQDLSEVELELIHKINLDYENSSENLRVIQPVFNMFGDVNQMITDHGIKDWTENDLVSNEYELDENFRNPNQIVDFCNREFPFKMQKIGVDMEPVGQFSVLSDAINSYPSIQSDAVFIVRDDYTKRDLQQELKNADISEYSVFTVKEVKGLEFKEIFVVDRGMTINEKYIAYTRALVKLNVINSLPYYVDLRENLFVQGEETDDE